MYRSQINNSAIRVAVLLPSLQVGGAERLVLEELACLKDDPSFAFELHLVFDKGPFFESFASLGLPVHVWSAPHRSLRMLFTYAAIIRHLRRTGCQILHSHLLDGIGPLVGKLAGVRTVATVHSDTLYSQVERFVLRRSDLVLGCGQQVMENIREFLPANKVISLPNAVRIPDSLMFSKDETLERLSIPVGSRLVVSLGRFTRTKGFDVLIEAFRRVADVVLDVVLLIGGDGEEMANLKELASSSGYGDRIRLPGMISNIHEVLAACDLYVNSSRVEGLPMTLLEAMANGRPLVATRVGGNPEVVQDGVTGLLVPSDDPVKLADAIIQMLQDDSFRERTGDAAFELFCRSYTIDRHCAALKENYLRVLSGASA